MSVELYSTLAVAVYLTGVTVAGTLFCRKVLQRLDKLIEVNERQHGQLDFVVGDIKKKPAYVPIEHTPLAPHCDKGVSCQS